MVTPTAKSDLQLEGYYKKYNGIDAVGNNFFLRSLGSSIQCQGFQSGFVAAYTRCCKQNEQR